uniref:Uncharacterized protein n=1 Tax=Anguilla anguilla TaxID=7936 RepID=A0A0E9Q8K8_ANGAN
MAQRVNALYVTFIIFDLLTFYECAFKM